MGQAVAGEIRAERARLRKTMQDVYERAGMSKSAYLLIETGQRKANIVQLEGIARALDLRLSELFLRAESRLRENSTD